MKAFQEEKLPMADLIRLGLHNGTDWTMERKAREALLSGNLTPFVRLEKLKIDGNTPVSLDARLSLRRSDAGDVQLGIHPIYRNKVGHPLLTREDELYLKLDGVYARKEAAWGTIIQQGAAPYRFIPDNPRSPFIELEKPDGRRDRVWGTDLARAVSESGFSVGDAVQIKLAGTEQQKPGVEGEEQSPVQRETRLNWEVQALDAKRLEEKQALYEFDSQTNSTVRTDDRQFQLPEQVNGTTLNPRLKERLRRGEEIELADGTRLQVSPASDTQFRSNRLLLVASMILDGGFSYAIYKGVNALVENGKKQQQTYPEASLKYVEALHLVQKDLEQKQARYPGDKQIAHDLDLVRDETIRLSGSPAAKVSQITNRLDDPDLENQAKERERRAESDKHENNREVRHPEDPISQANSESEGRTYSPRR